MRRIISTIMALGIVIGSLAGCQSTTPDTTKSEQVPTQTQEEVTLTIAGPWPDCTALEKVAASFTEEYPNCHIVYEYLQNFSDTLSVRLEGEEDKLDLYFSNNIQNGSELIPYTLELSSLGDELDLSNCFEGLVDNFKLQSSDENEKEMFYSIPLGGEIRGMYVNLTLLESLNLEVPKTLEEFLADCEVLKENGYVPIQGNPGMFGAQFLYPYVCNLIANSDNYEETYNIINQRQEEMVEILQAPVELMYQLVEAGYYNYKHCETELNLFTDASNEGYTRSFLNIQETEDGYEKKDDIGQVAFMPFTKSLDSTIEKTKEDYHSDIEYAFILSPVSEDGGYAYLSPGRGIAVNKSSDHIDWCAVFLNYLFEEENNIAFSEDMGFVPNTKDAISMLEESFDIPRTSISHLGQVTFDYDFYSVINDTLVEVSKSNNPKYMQAQDDGSVTMYPLSYYMDNFRARVVEGEK